MSLLDKARERGFTIVEDKPQQEFDADLIPQPEVNKSPQTLELDAAIDGINILDAYNRWCGKKVGKHTSRAEVQVSCPIPGHVDNNPSASVNTENGTWMCYACNQGGDKFDLAAWAFNFDVPGYKKDGSFPTIRRMMAEEFGYHVVTSVTGEQHAVPVEPEAAEAGSQIGAAPAPSCAPSTQDDLPVQQPPAQPAPSNIVQFPQHLGMSNDEYIKQIPILDWKSLIEPETFIWRFMNITTQLDIPDEYLFFSAMQIVAALCGDDVRLVDEPPIEPNLFVCLYGPTAIGKSRTINLVTEQLKVGSPYDHDNPFSAGTYIAPVPGSGEALLDIFAKYDTDSVTQQVIPRQVRAYVRFDELASLTGRSSRVGSTLKPTIMTLYDGKSIETKVRGAAGLTRVENPFCQIVTTTQPRAIRELLVQTDADSGFINRWVFVAGRPKPLIAFGRKPFDPNILKSEMGSIRSWASIGHDYTLTGASLKLWENFFRQELEPIKVDFEGDPMLARCDLTILKFIIILAANSKSPQPTEEHVQAAINMWPYLRDCYKLLATEVGLGKLDDCANAVLAAVISLQSQRKKPPTVNEVWQQRLKKRYSRDLVMAAFKVLVEIGQLKATPPQQQGDSHRYSVAS